MGRSAQRRSTASSTDLGPTKEQPKGPFGDVIESFADGLAGKGQQINKTLNSLSEALTTLNEGRGDFFGVVKSLALFVNALYKSDQQFVALNNDLASFTNSFTNTDREVANARSGLEQAADHHPTFLDKNGPGCSPTTSTTSPTSPTRSCSRQPRDGLETGLHVFPNLAANIVNISAPDTRAASSACR